jgi:hypothetical protein
MNNIEKIQNGFTFNKRTFQFQKFELGEELVFSEIISDTQAHIGTDQGVIMFDLSCPINNITYNDINSFVTELFLPNI